MPTSRIVLILFAFTLTSNVMASASGHASLVWATTPLLMPLLVGVLWFSRQENGRVPDRRDWAIITGLLLAATGNVALMLDVRPALGVGLVLLAAGHGCYLRAFARPPRRLRSAAAFGYAVVVAPALVWLWVGLGVLAVPMSAYAVAGVAMAVAATGHGWRVGLGAALTIASGLLLAVGLAGAATFPGPPVWVPLTAVLGQCLIVTGWAPARASSLQQVVA